jgi:pimeloyl-ACP methyl ester carboxylesterase
LSYDVVDDATGNVQYDEHVPTVILHGALGAGSNWRSLAKAVCAEPTIRSITHYLHLINRSMCVALSLSRSLSLPHLIQMSTKVGRIITVDVRNHGSSPHASDMSAACLLADMQLLLDRLQIRSANFVGHSMVCKCNASVAIVVAPTDRSIICETHRQGGKIAMELAFERPELLRRLVVVDIAPVAYVEVESIRSLIRALLDLRLEEVQSLKQADELLSASVRDAAIRAFLLTNLVPSGTGTSKYRWRANLRMYHQCTPPTNTC